MMVRGAELEGYCMDLLGALAGMLRFQYRVKVVGDGQYGAVAAGGNWTGMIGEVLRRVTPSLCSRPTLQGQDSGSSAWASLGFAQGLRNSGFSCLECRTDEQRDLELGLAYRDRNKAQGDSGHSSKPLFQPDTPRAALVCLSVSL